MLRCIEGTVYKAGSTQLTQKTRARREAGARSRCPRRQPSSRDRPCSEPREIHTGASNRLFSVLVRNESGQLSRQQRHAPAREPTDAAHDHLCGVTRPTIDSNDDSPQNSPTPRFRSLRKTFVAQSSRITNWGVARQRTSPASAPRDTTCTCPIERTRSCPPSQTRWLS